MKLPKKLLASQVNSVRPYKSRSKRPCDFCRKRKTCCIIEVSLPCMACLQFNKGDCTFVQDPVKRGNRKTAPAKSSKDTAPKQRKLKSAPQSDFHESPSSPNREGSIVKAETFYDSQSAQQTPAQPQEPVSFYNFQERPKSQVCDQFRSQSDGNLAKSKNEMSSLSWMGAATHAQSYEALSELQAEAWQSQRNWKELYKQFCGESQLPHGCIRISERKEQESLSGHFLYNDYTNSLQLDDSVGSSSLSVGSADPTSSFWSPHTLETTATSNDYFDPVAEGPELFTAGQQKYYSAHSSSYQVRQPNMSMYLSSTDIYQLPENIDLYSYSTLNGNVQNTQNTAFHSGEMK